MGSVVELGAWRAGRRAPKALQDGEEAPWPEEVRRLDRAVDRLSRIVSRALEANGHLEPRTETELLAIMGALATGMLDDAARRAERLAGRLVDRRSASRG
jgi:hypothetical protein